MLTNNQTLEKASVLETYIRQSNIFRSLQSRFKQKQMSHGYLFTGAKGTGKYAMALLLAQMLFCSEKEKPCGWCSGCQKVKNQLHPDVMVISGENTIGVAQVRQAIQKAGEHTYEGGYRFILIEDAQKMTPQAQNALLKTLEEPYDDVVFCLLATEKQLLLPTILSRVQMISLPKATEQTIWHVLDQLELTQSQKEQITYFARGELGLALDYAGDSQFFEFRKEMIQKVLGIGSYYALEQSAIYYKEKKAQAEMLFKSLEELTRIALFVSLGIYPQQGVEDYPPAWIQMVKSRKNNPFFLQLIDKVFEAKHKYLSQVNWQGILEELFSFIMEENKKWQQ